MCRAQPKHLQSVRPARRINYLAFSRSPRKRHVDGTAAGFNTVRWTHRPIAPRRQLGSRSGLPLSRHVPTPVACRRGRKVAMRLNHPVPAHPLSPGHGGWQCTGSPAPGNGDRRIDCESAASWDDSTQRPLDRAGVPTESKDDFPATVGIISPNPAAAQYRIDRMKFRYGPIAQRRQPESRKLLGFSRNKSRIPDENSVHGPCRKAQYKERENPSDWI